MGSSSRWSNHISNLYFQCNDKSNSCSNLFKYYCHEYCKKTYASPEYAQHVQSYESLFDSFIGNLTQYCTRIEDTARSSYIVTLSVLGFCFLVVIPVMILVLMFIMKRDSQNEKLLNHTSQHLLKETLLDPALRSAFKLYCKERGLESTMNILEKVMQYKEHCKISHSIQMKVFELTHDYVKQHKEEKQKKSETSIGMNMIHTTSSSGNRTINKSLNSSQMQFASGEDRKALFIFKISNEADKKIIHQECLKSQLVFEIIDQSQDHSILSKVGTLESQHIDPQQIQHSE
ncbi:hypothetical protein C9374_008931 [Naegleria lovaniensis]|uniref:RGS domain-containing protein n=1 Tax=Naegleria lovaniensis TaxID=51637 RepID=A0AA88KH56_NAELO|nr:uncharacterized protein C9374_008931 [Naegleria lovaniensis]KAG2377846.1 hypothetical protein C9374_008931 [Naegleria lovaniensis]